MIDFHLRKALIEDSEFLLENRNNPEIYKYFHNNKPVERSDHEKWYASALTSNNNLVYIAESDSEKVGVIQLRIIDSTGLVSIYISPIHHGKGYALRSLNALKVYAQEMGLKNLTAEVVIENEASQRLFEKSGFNKSYITYTYNL
ncbi:MULTISPECIES: GNAT family N-acetyltransferase [unclassified Halobacteriovorax]|uniref:GNAT family N-acetyltransferase n=1 Tax=unclassified Halobacteriovorax TaxID=2639665 RepID=UPI00399B606B